MKSSTRTRPAASVPSTPAAGFDVQDYLESAGGTKSVTRYDRGQSVYRQGEASRHVMYVQSGGVKLSAVSPAGREAVVAMLGPGDFFGEGCLAGQPRYGQPEKPARVLPKVSQKTLAEVVGTTRSRVNALLSKFKKLGYIDYDGESPLTINSSLLGVVLHD